MDNQNLDLEIAKEKKMHLKKLYEEANAEAMSFYKLGVAWKDLEDYYNSMEKSIEERERLLEEREKFVLNELDFKKDELAQLSQELKSKRNELCSIEVKVLERSGEMEQKRVELSSVNDEHDLVKELHLTKDELLLMKNEFKEKLDSMENSLEELSEELHLRIQKGEVSKENNQRSENSVKPHEGGLESKKVQCLGQSSSQDQPLQKRRRSDRLEQHGTQNIGYC